jgi:ribosomal protein S18 acetylase RimI-like enzyme
MEISPIRDDAETHACAEMMASTEPWLTIGRTAGECYALLGDPMRETFVAREDGVLRGFVVIVMQGAFVGYIQAICVAPDARGSGVGTQLVAFAEDRILRESPNVFLCVSSFNPRARALYERLGYTLVGELTDYLIRGHSEALMRKSVAPIREFRR